MGYQIDFHGELRLNKPVDLETAQLLNGLARSRRMARNVDTKYGVEGEFYIPQDEDDSYKNEYDDATVINYNRPPATQPSLWLQWILTEDNQGIQWDGGEKFQQYIEWLVYLRNAVLAPRGYYFTGGEIFWYGEDYSDHGRIRVGPDGELITEVAHIEYR